MNKKSIYNFILTALLIVSLLCTEVSPAFAEPETVYIKEIVTSTGETSAEAKKWLISNGYTVLDSNLNDGTDEDPVYLGYKTTTDKSEAITDVSFMDMNGGYEMMDYSAFAASNQANIKSMTADLRTACNEMRAKLNSGSAAAQVALSYLNIFTVPEANMALGDYLLAENRTDSDYRMILLVCNSLVINIIYSELSLGCSDYGVENWAERAEELGPDETFRGDDYAEYWQEQYDLYYTDALNLYYILRSFREEHLAATARKNANGGEVQIIEATEEDAENAIEAFAENGESAEECANDAFIFSVMEYLNSFSYSSDLPTSVSDYSYIGVKPEYADRVIFDGTNAYFKIPSSGYGMYEDYTYEPIPFDFFIENYALVEYKFNTRLFTASTTLGDALMEIASCDEEDEDNISLLYPIVKSLTPAQLSLLCIQGLTSFTEISIIDSDGLNTLTENLPRYRDNLYEALGSETASVWIGTNRDLYDRKIALTSEARRNADASNDYDQITYVSDFDLNIKVALCYIGGAAAATAGVTLIALGLGAFVYHGAAATIVAGLMTMGGAISATISGVAFGCVGVIGIALSTVVIAALIVCAIVYAVDYFIDLYDYYNPDYTDIPSIIVDTTENGYITYNAVLGKNGKNADLNVWEGRRWNALYTTKDVRFGSPLILNEDGICFKTVKGSTKVPEGTVPVSRFGGNTAVNLNSNTYDDDVGGIYLYYFTESDGIGQHGDGMYLESLTLLCHEDANAVRETLKIKGYEIIDFNLTPDTDYATFIGYTTTKNANNAITDIRVSYSGSEAKYYYGDISDTYGFAGSNSKDTENEPTGLCTSLYYTKSKQRGTPIYANLLVTKSTSLPIDYEPVNLFSGGYAFDFNTYPEEDSDDWGDRVYVYFEPSVKYDESNSELYLGGIAFVSGSTDMDEGRLDNYVRQLGLTYYNYDLTKGFLNDEDRTWLCYSTTYNPYRAIYDIGVYTAEYRSTYLPENIVLDGVGYIACQTYTQGDISYYGNTFWGGNYRLIRPNHAYINNVDDYGGEDEYGDTLVCNRGMYVCGPESGKSPIKMSELNISRSATIPDGHVAVHDMTDKFASFALNLALYDRENRNALYITYPGTAPVKLNYIAKITVVSSTEEDFSYDTAMYKLMASGGDEIIKINLAETVSDSWRNTTYSAGFSEDLDIEDYEDSVSYIRITRTKVKNDAIGNVAIVFSDKTPAATLSLRYDESGNTTQFSKAGDKISYCEGRGYYLYYAKNGNRISDFVINRTPVISGDVTVLDSNMNLPTDIGYYFHTYANVSLPYYSHMNIATAGTDISAISALLKQGCTEVKKISKSGNPVYIGYAMTSSALKAVKNVIISSDTASEITVGDVTYGKYGTVNGKSLYTTTGGLKTKAITYFDFGADKPNSSAYPLNTLFEYVQDSSGNKANISSLIGVKSEQYMYIAHKDNDTYSENAYIGSVFADYPEIVHLSILALLVIICITAVIIIKKKKALKIAKEQYK